MFKISTVNQTYLRPITVDIPAGDGKFNKVNFKVQFRRLSQTEFDELHRRLNFDKLAEGEKLITDNEICDQVVAGWEGVMDDDDVPLDFTPENFTALKDVYPVRPTLVREWFESMKEAKRKN